MYLFSQQLDASTNNLPLVVARQHDRNERSGVPVARRLALPKQFAYGNRQEAEGIARQVDRQNVPEEGESRSRVELEQQPCRVEIAHCCTLALVDLLTAHAG